jgi:hypothetical protein
MGLAALALEYDVAVPLEAVGFEGMQNGIGGAGLLARGIDILNANKPESVSDPGLQVTGNGGYE